MSARAIVFTLLGLTVLALAINLARVAPSPGDLSAVHAALPELHGLDGCERCHAHVGAVDGCTSCHAEIAAQLSSGTGWHGSLAAERPLDCGGCHGEHWGADFPLVHEHSWGEGSASANAHRHLDFKLTGAHQPLDCARCHVAMLPDGTADRLAIASTRRTYLGLTQACASCHDDPHGDAMSNDCGACHGQESFKPAAAFEHAQHFPLLGAHAQVSCAKCHPSAVVPAATVIDATMVRSAPLDFAVVRGTTCEQCHATPHRALPAGRCTTCHDASDLVFAAASARVTVDEHAKLGFALTPPHADRECRACHDPAVPFAKRFPGRASSDCTTCHESPHGGQFGARESDCAECHATHFVPSRITAAAHAPPLRARHADAACERCHQPPTPGAPARFVATPTTCSACHVDPHGGQFAARGDGCEACHDESRFTPSRFDFAARHPELLGAHANVGCDGCHRAPEPGAPVRFRATPTACDQCHVDVHGGQFRTRPGGCASCHDERHFAPSTFTAQRHQPALTGAHLAVACNDCHRANDTAVRAFAGTPRDCKSCHADPHGGQLTRKGDDCNRCHQSDERWLPVTFDHQRDSRFALDGVHARLACSACHSPVKVAGGRSDDRVMIHYVPLGVECRDCHTGR